MSFHLCPNRLSLGLSEGVCEESQAQWVPSGVGREGYGGYFRHPGSQDKGDEGCKNYEAPEPDTGDSGRHGGPAGRDAQQCQCPHIFDESRPPLRRVHVVVHAEIVCCEPGSSCQLPAHARTASSKLEGARVPHRGALAALREENPARYVRGSNKRTLQLLVYSPHCQAQG